MWHLINPIQSGPNPGAPRGSLHNTSNAARFFGADCLMPLDKLCDGVQQSPDRFQLISQDPHNGTMRFVLPAFLLDRLIFAGYSGGYYARACTEARSEDSRGDTHCG